MRIQLWMGSLAIALTVASSAFAPGVASAQVVIEGQVTYTEGSAGSASYEAAPEAYPQAPTTYQAAPASAQAYGSTAYTQPASGPQPTRYVTRSGPNLGLIIPGVILLAGGYVTTIAGTQLTGWTSEQTAVAALPVLGPFIQLAMFSDIDRSFDDGLGIFALVTGLAQVVGLTLTIVGLAVPEEWEEPVYALTDDPNGPALSFDGTSLALRF